MLGFGIYTPQQYDRAVAANDLAIASRIYLGLLDVAENPSEEEVRMFEQISLTFRTANGTYRTSFRNRFQDVDLVSSRIIRESFKPSYELHVQDRAASHALTSCEWASQLFPLFRNMAFEASDDLIDLVRISFPQGETYIAEPDGQLLQYFKAPFVVGLSHREPRRYPLNSLIAANAKRRFRRLTNAEKWLDSPSGNNCRVKKISCIHPHARSMANNDGRFRICRRSVFDYTPSVDVLRTMNILNKVYFTSDQLIAGADAAFNSLRPGGIWIVGRTMEEDQTNHATFLRRRDEDWEILARVGNGSEMEEFAVRTPDALPEASR
jgi:hypothetical protein